VVGRFSSTLELCEISRPTTLQQCFQWQRRWFLANNIFVPAAREGCGGDGGGGYGGAKAVR